jgi:hypothetical protein
MSKGIFYAVAAMLFLALAPLPYAYYEILRVVACGTFGYLAYVAVQRSANFHVALFAITAIIFNPIIPIYFDRAIWAIIDASAGVALLLATRHYIEE